MGQLSVQKNSLAVAIRSYTSQVVLMVTRDFLQCPNCSYPRDELDNPTEGRQLVLFGAIVALNADIVRKAA